MKVFINRTTVQGAWGGGNNLVKAFYEYAHEFGIETTFNPKQADAVFIAGMPAENGSPSAFDLLWHPKKLFRVNECDSRKNTAGVDDTIRQIAANCQKTVYVSNWLKSELKGTGEVIYNGCDADIFKPNKKLNNDKINIITHHWSSNKLKGEETHEWLDCFVKKHSEFTYTYVGRSEYFFRNSMLIKPIFGHTLGAVLGSYDVYVTATKNDPGPNHVIESISCGLSTYCHSSGGGAVEFCGTDHTFSSHDELENILLNTSFGMNAFQPESWRTCVQKYAKLLLEM